MARSRAVNASLYRRCASARSATRRLTNPGLDSGLTLARYPLVWEHERAEKPVGNPKYREVETLGHLTEWLDEIG